MGKVAHYFFSHSKKRSWIKEPQRDVNYLTNPFTKPMRVLDVGCGNFRLARALPADKIMSWIGLDFVPPDVEADFWQAPPFKMFVHADISRPLNGVVQGKFDICLCIGVLQYLTHDECRRLCQDLHDMLVPGGSIIIRQQFGVTDTVRISGRRPDLDGLPYEAEYRPIDVERTTLLMSGFKNVAEDPSWADGFTQPYENTRFSIIKGECA